MTTQEQGLQRFAVLSNARSGSNMLKSLLDKHPRVKCLGEIFNPVYGAGYVNWVNRSALRRFIGRYLRNHCVESYLDSLVQGQTGGKSLQAHGFKVMYPGQFYRCSIFPYYWQEREFKIIRLTRRNLLRRYLSGRIAERENVWSAQAHRGEQLTIRIDLEDLRRSIKRMETINQNTDALAWEFPNIMIDYERLVADRTTVMKTIFEFIGVNPAEVEDMNSSTARQNPGKLHALIENFDEVRATLLATQHEWFLEDQQDI